MFASRAGENRAAPRIVSLAPNLTELVCVLGLRDHLAGRSSACDYPPEVATVPVAGGFGRPNLDAILELRPDLLVFSDAEKPGLLRWAETAGIRVLRLPCTSWAEIEDAARALADAAGVPERAEAWLRESAARRDAVMKRRASHRPPLRVYVEVWGDPLTTAGAGSHLQEVVTMAGGENIAGELRAAYPHVSAEWVLRQGPDVILLTRMQPAEDLAARIRRRPGWADVPAVRRGHIIADMDPDLLLRPGPRLLDGMEQLAERFAAICVALGTEEGRTWSP